MKLITRNTDYAIRALCYFAKRKEKIISVRELVDNLGIPRPFLRKILQRLNKRSLLRSYKGKDGGFLLSRAPRKIFVTDLIKIFQGPIRLSTHLFKKDCCPNIKTCVLKKKMDAIEKYVISKLKSITIASLTGNIIKD